MINEVLYEVRKACDNLWVKEFIYNARQELKALRDREGRLFIIGLGGGAANASHAANDYRKLCGIETYTPTDNVAEFSAWANDIGWDSSFLGYLQASRFNSDDVLMVFSVGGGQTDVSVPISHAVRYTSEVKATIMGIVGLGTGMTYALGGTRLVLVVPCDDKKLLTPVTEAMQMVIHHQLVTGPPLQLSDTKW